MSLTQEIKEFALDLGFSRVGIAPADPFESHIRELENRAGMYAAFLPPPLQLLAAADPRAAFPEAKSIISVAYDYAQTDFPRNLLASVGRLYLARCYHAPAHRIHGARLALMNGFLERHGCRLGQEGHPERLAAARAGVATFGNNNFAYVDGIGSFVVLSSFVVDVELEYDQPTLDVGCPEGCSACRDACPTGALYAPLKLDPRRCIGNLNWVTQDRPPRTSAFIPFDLRKPMGLHIHGCDLCQEACPRNRARLNAPQPTDPFLETLARDFSLPKVLNMTDAYYRARVHPIMYNYIKDKKYIQRNAAIALGNLGDPAHVPDLARALEDPEPLVRGYAAWALGEIGGREARACVEASLLRETSADARSEMEAALGQP
jgi:epoxyqueuosine reductase